MTAFFKTLLTAIFLMMLLFSFSLTGDEKSIKTFDVYKYIEETSNQKCGKENCEVNILKITQQQFLNEKCMGFCPENIDSCLKKHEILRDTLKKNFKTEKMWVISILKYSNEKCKAMVDDGGITIYYDPIAMKLIEF